MRRIFLVLLVGTVLVLPSLSLAADTQSGLVPCDGVTEKDASGKIISPACQVCHVIELGQRIINFLVGIASFLAVGLFAYAGWLMLSAAGDTGKVSTAHGIFTNVVVGMVIVLAGWLIVDTVMKWTFQGTTDEEKGSPLYEQAKKDWKFGPWNEIKCVILPGYVPSQPGGPSLTLGSGGGAGGNRGKQLCPETNPDCSPAVMVQAGFTDPKQANAMSCIAMTESSGKPDGPCSKNEDGTDNACGLFQITQGNWNNPALHRNAPCSTDRSYINNATCNRETAFLLFQASRNTPYNDWTGVYTEGPKTGQPFNPAARTCVETYDPANVRWQT